MNGYALDSNIVSFHIKERPAVVRRLKEAKDNQRQVGIPPFAYYEVKRGLLAINAAARLRQLAKFCEEHPVGRNDDRVFEEAAVIWADLTNKGWNIDEMDIFIAAWCKVNDFTLVTNNTAHFAHIPGLALEDWSV
ncbi:MAG: Ribonuclease VapC2 [Treponematales bacterium]